MEPLFAVLKSAVENGWKLGFVLLVVGGAVPVLDHFDVPKPGALKEWVGLSTIFAVVGFAAIITWAGATYLGSWHQRRRESNEVLENIQTLIKDQLSFVCSLLERPRRLDVPHQSVVLVDLIRKKVLVTVSEGMDSWVCELHPAILAERQRLLPVLCQACDMPGAFPKVQRRSKEWTVLQG